MDRPTVYTQEQGRSVDFLFAQRATMIGLGKLAQAAFGSNAVVRGLAVTPNSPAALNVLVAIGEIYSVQQVDATPWGALPADVTDFIVKQGLNMAVQTISTPAPTTSGFSINYLIEAQYQDQDTNAAVLPYYNSTNPQIPLNGQGGSGAPQSTQRQGVCVIQAKAGVAAATGTQVTPTVDSGWTALAVVTVANGATTVTAGNISVPAGVPQVTSLLQMMQTESTNYALDTSATPNQINIALTPPIASYTDGMQLNFRAANNSSNAVNINAGPGNISLSGAAGALQSGEIVAGGYYTAVYQSNTGAAVLVGQGAGAEQVNPPTQPKHAAQFAQIGNMKSAISVNANTTLTASQTGSYVQISSGSGLTVTLPPAVAGAAFPIYNNTNATHTLKGNGSQVINNGSGNANTYTILPWAAIWVASDGASYSIISGAGDVLLTTNGWERKPSGLIECWAQGTTNGSGTVTITLPITFPNSQLIGMVCGQNGAAVAACVTIQSLTTSQVIVNAVNGSASPISGLQVNIRALGK
ncbi:gp53-like domain-containing protein [Paraburkholderia sediminicola]|uniref:gp53-like domain-containing protein n=1 Tax=Paraburkholderia sediminicola TaxID=458836 RepID=UPI0038B900E7